VHSLPVLLLLYAVLGTVQSRWYMSLHTSLQNSCMNMHTQTLGNTHVHAYTHRGVHEVATWAFMPKEHGGAGKFVYVVGVVVCVCVYVFV